MVEGTLVLKRWVHGESRHAYIRERNCVGAKEKNRKKGGRGGETVVARPEPEQVKEEGVDDEIVREFLLENSIKLEPAGKRPGGSGPGDGGKEFCAGAGGEPGDVECDGEGAWIADAAGFSEVNFQSEFRQR